MYKGVKLCFTLLQLWIHKLSTGSTDLVGNTSNGAFIILFFLVTFPESLGRNSVSPKRFAARKLLKFQEERRARKGNKNRKGKLKKTEL